MLRQRQTWSHFSSVLMKLPIREPSRVPISQKTVLMLMDSKSGSGTIIRINPHGLKNGDINVVTLYHI